MLWAYRILPEDCSIKIADADSRFKELSSVTSLVAFVSKELSSSKLETPAEVLVTVFIFVLVVLFVDIVLERLVFVVEFVIFMVLEEFVELLTTFNVLALLDQTYKESSEANTKEE